jgi:hypothetical protein
MNHLKTAGIAIGLLAATMALGAGGALGAQVCATGTPGDSCPAGKREYSGTVAMSSQNLVITNSISNVTCGNSSASLSLNNSTGIFEVEGFVTSVGLSSCETAGGTFCSAEPQNLQWLADLRATKLEVFDSLANGVAISVKCGFLINCTFGTSEAVFAVSGGGGQITGSKIVLNRSGGFCPSTSELDVTWTVTSPAGFTVL